MKNEWKEFQAESVAVPEELGVRILSKVKADLESEKISGAVVRTAPENELISTTQVDLIV